MDASLPGKFYILNMSTEGLVKEHVNVFHKMYLNRIRPFIAFFPPGVYWVCSSDDGQAINTNWLQLASC